MDSMKIFLCLILAVCSSVVNSKPAQTEHLTSDEQETKILARDLSGDVPGSQLGRGGRFRRYSLHGSKWMKEVLTWRYQHNENSKNAWRANNTRGLTEDDVRDVINKAMALWESHANIKFEEDRSNTEPDIWVKFVTGAHGDPFPFSNGRTPAHAFYPLNNTGLAGDIHFNDDVMFSIGKPIGSGDTFDLTWIAVHSLGHALGLEHSRLQDSTMYPVYPGDQKDIKLTDDDIRAVQTLYGAPKKPTPPQPVFEEMLP